MVEVDAEDVTMCSPEFLDRCENAGWSEESLLAAMESLSPFDASPGAEGECKQAEGKLRTEPSSGAEPAAKVTPVCKPAARCKDVRVLGAQSVNRRPQDDQAQSPSCFVRGFDVDALKDEAVRTSSYNLDQCPGLGFEQGGYTIMHILST